MAVTEKRYDQAYFDYWYRERGFHDEANVAELASAIVDVVRTHHDSVRRILDVGAGEGRWRAPLLELTGGAYTGIDGSTYAVDRYGSERNLWLMRIGGIPLRGTNDPFDEPFDLILSVNVLEYVKLKELRAGLEALTHLCRGVAHFLVFEEADEGDPVGFRRRPFARPRVGRHEKHRDISWREIFEVTGWVPLERFKHFYIPRARAERGERGWRLRR